MGVFTFVFRNSGGEWNAKQHSGNIEASAVSTYDLQRKLVQAVLAVDSSSNIQTSFSLVTPSSAVFQVIVGGAVFVGAEKKKFNELLELPPHGSEKFNELLELPPHGSEVFIGGIPQNVSDEDLKVFCQSVGEVWEVRIVKGKDSGEVKDYAFVTFKTKELAYKAIEELNNAEFKGKRIKCSRSRVKQKLFVTDVPNDWTRKKMKEVFAEVGPGVICVEMLKDLQNSDHNCGIAFVKYYNHACAEYSMEKMSNLTFKLGNNTPTVSWADPRSFEASQEWRATDILNPVRNQGSSECCYAFTACAAIEALYCLKYKEHISLSRQDIYNHLFNPDESEEKKGVSITKTLRWLMDNGCILEETCPYSGIFTKCNYDRKIFLKITGFVSYSTVKEIEAAVRKQPLMAEVYWSDELDNLEKDDIYPGPKDSSGFKEENMHGVLLIGFGEKRKKNQITKFWIVQNSHGTTWCDGGFGKITQAECHKKFVIPNAWAPRGLEVFP